MDYKNNIYIQIYMRVLFSCLLKRIIIINLVYRWVQNFTLEDSLESMHSGLLKLDLTPFHQGQYIIGTNLKITLESTRIANTIQNRSWTSVKVPNYFNSTLNSKSIILGHATWKLRNMQNTTIYFRLNLTTVPTNSTLDLLYLKRKYVYFESTPNQVFYAALIDDITSSNQILPFNIIDYQDLQLFSDNLYSDILVSYNYQTSPTTTKFWSQQSMTSVALPWLPYFSSCTQYDRRILLGELLKMQSLITNIPQNPFDFKYSSNQEYAYNLSCFLQETLINSQFKPWWKSEASILYSIYSKPLTGSQFNIFSSDQTLLDGLVSNFYKDLVPVYYFPIGPYVNNPFHLQMNLKFMQQGNKKKLVYAQILAKFNQTYQDNITALDINIRILNKWDMIVSLCLSYQVYLGFFTIMMLILIGMTVIGVFAGGKDKTLRFFGRFFADILFPMIKGFGLAMGISFGQGLFLFFIAKYMNLSGFENNYDNITITDQSQELVNYGRIGLIFMFTGYFLGKTITNISFKVPNPSEAEIIVKDELKHEKQNTKSSSQETQQLNEKVQFFIRVMQSKKNMMFLYYFLITIILVYKYELLLYLAKISKEYFTFVVIIILPLFMELMFYFFEEVVIKDWIFIHALVVLEELLISIVSMSYQKIQITLIMLVCRKIYLALFHLFIENLKIYVCEKIQEARNHRYNNLQFTDNQNIINRPMKFTPLPSLKNNTRHHSSPNKKSLLQYFYKKFEKKINKQRDCQNEMKTVLILTAHIQSSILRPFMLVLFILLQKQLQLNAKFFIQQKFIEVYLIFSLVVSILIELLLGCLIAHLAVSRYGLNIFQMLEYCSYRFKNRNCKWMSEMRISNSFVEEAYRNVEKLLFSSQFYFFSFSITIAISFLCIGLDIITMNYYSVFNDPFFAAIFFLMYFITHLIKMPGTFFVNKFKLYVRTPEKNISNLDTVQNILKIDDYEKYLQLDTIKNQFLISNKTWIVKNLSKLFSVRDFYANDKELLNNYLFYLNKQKRKQIEGKKKEILLRKQNEAKLLFFRRDNNNNNNIISIRLPLLNNIIKPIIYNWLYLAKQQVYLKTIVAKTIENKKLNYCEFCKIDAELQVLENEPFYKIVNKFRIQNAGRMFTPIYFQEFYKMKQVFTTICIQCKEKKEHIKRNERNELKKIRYNKCGIVLVKKWLMIAKSRLLHKGIIIDSTKKINSHSSLLAKS